MDCVRASVYGCGRPFQKIAGDLDMRPSELSRKLADNPNDNVHFPVERLADLVRATGDLRPVYWLAETFLETQEAKEARVIGEIERAIKAIPTLAERLEALKK